MHRQGCRVFVLPLICALYSRSRTPVFSAGLPSFRLVSEGIRSSRAYRHTRWSIPGEAYSVASYCVDSQMSSGAWAGRAKRLFEQADYGSRQADQWTQRMIDDIIKLARNVSMAPALCESVNGCTHTQAVVQLLYNACTQVSFVCFFSRLKSICVHVSGLSQ